MMTFMKARFAQQDRDRVRKHTTTAMRQKAEQGLVTGGKVFGYDNVRLAKGQTTRVVNAAEAAVVRDIYTRYAEGSGLRTIALGLNRTKALSPRAQLGARTAGVRRVKASPKWRPCYYPGSSGLCSCTSQHPSTFRSIPQSETGCSMG
jgi:DNA invertase Pin-like site-specific DNA recombinase